MDKLLEYLNLPSPLEEIEIGDTETRFFLKRDELIHKDISGNKYRKLLGFLEVYYRDNYDGLLTFGGAFSNHIAATAAVCKMLNIPCVGVIRGDGFDHENPTLAFAKEQNMQFEFMSRSQYRQKEQSPDFNEIENKYQNYLIVPEGGMGALGVVGVKGLAEEIKKQCPNRDLIITAIGTGTTMAGLVAYSDCEVAGVPALRNKSTANAIDSLLSDIGKANTEFTLFSDYHFGGFAKFTQELMDFKNEFEKKSNIILDPIYTSKLLYAVVDLDRRGLLAQYKNIVIIHSGGLQGNAGFRYRFPQLFPGE